MATKRHSYKEVIRKKIVSIRLTEEEFLRLRVGGLRTKRSVSALLRDRMTDLIGIGTENGVVGTAEPLQA